MTSRHVGRLFPGHGRLPIATCSANSSPRSSPWSPIFASERLLPSIRVAGNEHSGASPMKMHLRSSASSISGSCRQCCSMHSHAPRAQMPQKGTARACSRGHHTLYWARLYLAYRGKIREHHWCWCLDLQAGCLVHVSSAPMLLAEPPRGPMT